MFLTLMLPYDINAGKGRRWHTRCRFFVEPRRRQAKPARRRAVALRPLSNGPALTGSLGSELWCRSGPVHPKRGSDSRKARQCCRLAACAPGGRGAPPRLDGGGVAAGGLAVGVGLLLRFLAGLGQRVLAPVRVVVEPPAEHEAGHRADGERPPDRVGAQPVVG